MTYSYADMEEFWTTIKDYFETNELRLSWSTKLCSDPDYVALITKITDLETDEYEESLFPIKLSNSDFRADGARFSYWRRMCALAITGVITTDDVKAQEFGYEEKPRNKETAKEKPPASKQNIVW